MNLHPSKSMLALWLACAAIYFLLPFQLLDRQMTWAGGAVLVLFISSFVVGSMLFQGDQYAPAELPCLSVDSRQAEYVLMTVSVFATAFFIMDARGKDLFDLVAAYEMRTESANALLKGETPTTSIWFQMAFALYPAAYVFLVVHLLFSPRVGKTKMIFFGLLPIGLAAISMGGRMPILYALLLTWLAYRQRHKLDLEDDVEGAGQGGGWRRNLLVGTIAIMVGALFYYFAAVFLVRAETMGGAAQMFEVAEENWGVAFRGPLTDELFAVLGEGATYLVFIFVWYLVQGLVIANYVFSSYEGPLQLGVYGIDLMSAVMRRIDPVNLAEGFDSLLTLGAYGFFPSAWGSLYVDFGYLGILVCLGWGCFAGLAYQRIVRERRTDWLLVGPFVSAGIAVSTINTPLGFANGFVTHCWLLLVFFLLNRQFDQQNSVRPKTAPNQSLLG